MMTIKEALKNDIIFKSNELLKLLPSEGRIMKEISLSKTQFDFYGGELCHIKINHSSYGSGETIGEWYDEDDNLVTTDFLFNKIIEIEDL